MLTVSRQRMCGILGVYNLISVSQCLTPLQPMGSTGGECLCGHASVGHVIIPSLPPRGGCVESGCPRFVTVSFPTLAPPYTF